MMVCISRGRSFSGIEETTVLQVNSIVSRTVMERIGGFRLGVSVYFIPDLPSVGVCINNALEEHHSI